MMRIYSDVLLYSPSWYVACEATSSNPVPIHPIQPVAQPIRVPRKFNHLDSSPSGAAGRMLGLSATGLGFVIQPRAAYSFSRNHDPPWAIFCFHSKKRWEEKEQNDNVGYVNDLCPDSWNPMFLILPSFCSAFGLFLSLFVCQILHKEGAW